MEQSRFDAIKAGKGDDVNRLIRDNPTLLKSRDASGASP